MTFTFLFSNLMLRITHITRSGAFIFSRQSALKMCLKINRPVKTLRNNEKQFRQSPTYPFFNSGVVSGLGRSGLWAPRLKTVQIYHAINYVCVVSWQNKRKIPVVSSFEVLYSLPRKKRFYLCTGNFILLIIHFRIQIFV